MKGRLLFLFVVLFFRFSLGFIEVSNIRQNSSVIVTGNIYNIYHKGSNCVIAIDKFWIDFRNQCPYSIGAKVRVIGKVRSRVIDKFLGRIWLDSAEITIFESRRPDASFFQEVYNIFDHLRDYCASLYGRYLPEPESGLIAGIVLGYKKDIGQEFYDQMIKSGTVHIAVASGYNIMLVGGTVLTLCFWFMKRKFASVFAIFAMIVYALEAGGEPPVMRAVIMASVLFFAAAMGKKAISWWILLLTGWFMVLVEPLLLVDVSFQLSMAASVGLMVFEPAIRKMMMNHHEKLGNILGGLGILTSFSTMVTTTPIIWWNFGRMSWIGIVSNILILPLVPILMITGALMQVLPDVFSWPTYAVAHWMVMVIRFFGG